MKFADRLVNLVSGMGTSKDKTIAAVYGFEELGPQQLLAAYRGDWIARKVVDIPAFDMIREGRAWQASDPQIQSMEAEEARLQVWPKLAWALKLARLYGGSALILGNGDGDTTAPLEVGSIGKGGLQYIHVASRYEITEGEIERDPLSPHWGEAKTYTMTTSAGASLELHPSRVIPFVGAPVPDVLINRCWGDSVLQAVDDAVKNAGLTSSGIAALVQEAKVDIYKIPNFLANVGDEAYRQRVLTRLSLANTGKGLSNGLLMDAEEEYEQKTINFAQLPQVLQTYLQVAAGAADIPATRLLGQSPTGLSSTGEADLRNYYDRIRAEQNVMLRPRLERLDAVMIRSALGVRPRSIHFEFRPLWQLDEVQRSENRKRDADTAKVYVDSGLIPLPALAKAVQNALVEQGTYPGLEASLAETKAVVGLSTEMFKVMVAAQKGGGMPKQVLHERLRAAGLLPADLMDYDAFSKSMEAEKPEPVAPIDPKTGKPVATVNPDPAVMGDAAPRTLYVQRKLLNAEEFIAWARGQGFGQTLAADDLHVTITYSRAPVDWMAMGESWSGDGKGNLTVSAGGPRLVEALGDKGAVVLLFSSTDLQWRHMSMVERGCSWDFPEYQPHVTITYAGSDVDLSQVEPYRGRLVFGPELFSELDEDWADKVRET